MKAQNNKKFVLTSFIVFLLFVGGFLGYRVYNNPLNRIKREGVIKVGTTADYLQINKQESPIF